MMEDGDYFIFDGTSIQAGLEDFHGRHFRNNGRAFVETITQGTTG